MYGRISHSRISLFIFTALIVTAVGILIYCGMARDPLVSYERDQIAAPAHIASAHGTSVKSPAFLRAF